MSEPKRKRRTRLKVFGWYGHRREAAKGGRREQTREILAAHSITECLRITGEPTRAWLWQITETGNAAEIAAAMAEPGVVFWRQSDDYSGPWNRAEPR